MTHVTIICLSITSMIARLAVISHILVCNRIICEYLGNLEEHFPHSSLAFHDQVSLVYLFKYHNADVSLCRPIIYLGFDWSPRLQDYIECKIPTYVQPETASGHYGYEAYFTPGSLMYSMRLNPLSCGSRTKF